MAIPRRATLAGLAAMCAAAAAGCAAGAPGSAGPVSGSPSATSSAPARSSAPAPSSATARAARCRPGQIRVSMGRSGAATGHVGATLLFTNTGAATCALSGWPVVVAVTAAGRRVAVTRVLSTFFGPPNLKAPPELTLAPGARAGASLAGEDFPLRGTTCPPSYRRLLITPPGGGAPTVLSGWIGGLGHYLPACGPILISPLAPLSELP